MLKVYLVDVLALGDNKIHIVTANDEQHVIKLVKEFWFNDSSIVIQGIKEIEDCGVQITKHEIA